MCLICGEEEAVRLCGLHRILNNDMTEHEEACLSSYSDGEACLSDDLRSSCVDASGYSVDDDSSSGEDVCSPFANFRIIYRP